MGTSAARQFCHRVYGLKLPARETSKGRVRIEIFIAEGVDSAFAARTNPGH